MPKGKLPRPRRTKPRIVPLVKRYGPKNALAIENAIPRIALMDKKEIETLIMIIERSGGAKMYIRDIKKQKRTQDRKAREFHLLFRAQNK